jgi:SAM-dependent methyltransferase
MSSSPPPLFDRALLRRRLARAVAAGAEDFLLTRAMDDMLDRLAAIRRDFCAIADLGTPAPSFARRLAAHFPAASIARMAPLPERDVSPSILTCVGDEEVLPFAVERFDLATSLLALQHVNDLPGAFVQVRRILKPDGLFLGCLVGGRSLHELRSAFTQAETEIAGGVSPRVAPFADVRDAGQLLQRAGFALPVADSDNVVVRYETMFGLVEDLRAMGATNALAARLRRPMPRRLALRAAEIYAQRFADPDGRLRATFELVFISGWAPHESQQKPLAPGAAKMRLAEALGAIEQSAEADRR